MLLFRFCFYSQLSFQKSFISAEILAGLLKRTKLDYLEDLTIEINQKVLSKYAQIQMKTK